MVSARGLSRVIAPAVTFFPLVLPPSHPGPHVFALPPLFCAVHHFAEFEVFTMLESDMEHAFLTESCEGMTPTDTQKNIVYVVAKEMAEPCGPEELAVAVAKKFVDEYPLVSRAKVRVELKPWRRLIGNDGAPHDHGYVAAGTETRTAFASLGKDGSLALQGGVRDLKVLKTTQSGYAGFLKDKYTSLGDSFDRIVATSVTATWRYTRRPACYDAAFAAIKAAFCDAFYGPSKGGLYSPSVQFTLYDMAQRALRRVPEIDSVFLNMPNLHFVPCAPITSTFDNDVYVATSEPHGNIEAVVTRQQAVPHAKL